jgi:DNA-3-methyladenine glycosylase I
MKRDSPLFATSFQPLERAIMAASRASAPRSWTFRCGRAILLTRPDTDRLMSDTKKRCPWSLAVDDDYRRYHDEEWGVPVRDDRRHFEFLVLEGAQAGLSWATVLRKRDGYRRAFADFDAARVARFNARTIERLVGDAGIIRNRQKIAATVTNARSFLQIQDEFGSFDTYVWGFVDGRPIVNRWKRPGQVPATSPLSDALSKDLKQRGFKFVGSTIVYAHMQATGIVNDHLVSCYRYPECHGL